MRRSSGSFEMTARHTAIFSATRHARLRRWVSGVVLLAILLTQSAIAAHVCPPMRAGDRQADVGMAAMPCAGSMASGAQGMDPDRAALCLEHCKPAAQTVDAGYTATLVSPALLAVIVPGVGDDEGDRSPSWTAHARARDRAPQPEHSIFHCCLRI